MISVNCDKQPWSGQTSLLAFQLLSCQVLLVVFAQLWPVFAIMATLITCNLCGVAARAEPKYSYGSCTLRCACNAVNNRHFAADNHKDESPENSKDVSVRQANKLSRDTRKNIVDKALATRDQDQYRFLKLIKDRMDM